MPGIQEMLVIAFVALVVLGPERLPQVARKAGELVARFRSETRRNVDELKRIAEVEDLERELHGLRQELRDTREDVAGTVGGPQQRRGGGRGGVRAPQAGSGRRGRLVRADDDPPPIDPEAT